MGRHKKTKSDTCQNGLTAIQEKAVELLASGKRVGEVATELGIHRATLWEWTQLPAFAEAQEALRREVWAASAARMRQNATRAADVIGEILDNSQATPRDRLSAAKLALVATGPLFSHADDQEKRRSEPYSWEGLVKQTAERAAEMVGGHIWSHDCHTPGEYWAKVCLSHESFEHLKTLRDDPKAAQEYCAELLEGWQDCIDAEAFQVDEEAAS